VGQAVCDRIDERHKSILPDRIWGDGKEDGVRARAAEEMKNTARAAAKMGLKVVPGFTGSPIWHMLYSFPPNPGDFLEQGLKLFADTWTPILDVFQAEGVKFGLEVHPTEIAFDVASAEAALNAVKRHPAFGFNYDPSHFGYQGVDYVAFIRKFADRIFHVHMKDVWWSSKPTEAGVFGGHLNFGDPRRFWDFRSLGRGSINFEEIIRALNDIGYWGPLSVEWEDGKMDREHGATEAAAFLHKLDFAPSAIAFDAAFEKK
jgi:sugar phosphate isomerase/epimerase